MKRRAFLSRSAGLFAAGAFAPSFASAQSNNASAPGAAVSSDHLKQFLPTTLPAPVVKPGEFVYAAAHFDHGHLTGQCQSLSAAGGTLKWIYEPDAQKRDAFVRRFKDVKVARSLDEILADPEVRLVTAAAVPNERGPIGVRVLEAGKNYFTDKTPFTTMEQLAAARAAVARTRRKYMVYFSERLSVESAMYATDLVQAGAIGRVVQVIGMGPHRLGTGRPAWFFEREKYGGILCDIGSHQFEQFLTYTGAKDATVASAAVGNFANPATPELEDFGEATLIGDNGSTNMIRVDWFTPAGLSTWGDGRTFILGTKGYVELRKYVDVARTRNGDQVFVVDDKGEHHLDVRGKVGTRFFGQFILDCLNRTEVAMTQEHAFKAAELCLKAQAAARWLT